MEGAGHRDPVVGITGMPGAGKTTVARWFARRYGVHIDADALGHEVLRQQEVVRQVRERFGPEVIRQGEVQRAALAAQAFSSPEGIAALNAICHPPIRAKVMALLAAGAGTGGFFVLDAPLLFESGFGDICQLTVSLHAPRARRLGRLASRGWDEIELGRRERGHDEALKRRRAQLRLDCSGELEVGSLASSALEKKIIELELALRSHMWRDPRVGVWASAVIRTLEDEFSWKEELAHPGP